MCLVIFFLSFGFAYMFYDEGNIFGASIASIIALTFFILIIRNIIQRKKEDKS